MVWYDRENVFESKPIEIGKCKEKKWLKKLTEDHNVRKGKQQSCKTDT